jgi:NitT/TauT family transport system ATP-binding protein
VNAVDRGAVELRSVGMVFGSGDKRVQAVKDVSLSVQPGEFVSLVGPSGCGKSSLLAVLAGFTKPTSGIATLNGVPIRKPGSERGVVFQQYSLLPWLTVRKNVEFGLKMKGTPRAQREKTARSLLELAGLSAFGNHFPDQLSGGMKQRIGIVRALATNPEVLLMDEPFGALDTQTRSVMQEILTDMWQQFLHHPRHRGVGVPVRSGVRDDGAARPHQGRDQGSSPSPADGGNDANPGVHRAGPRAEGVDPK